MDIKTELRVLQAHVKQNVTADHIIGDVLDVLEELNADVEHVGMAANNHFNDTGSHIHKADSQEELKPCPFCGSKSVRVDNTFIEMFIAVCPLCGTRTSEHPYKDEAIKAWNRRSNA